MPQVDLTEEKTHFMPMKSHVFISVGLLIAAIFLMRGLEALNEPGLGFREIYSLGGFFMAGLLIRRGWKDHKAKA